MCISAIVETTRTKAAALLGLSHLDAMTADSALPTSTDGELSRRIEARSEAWIIRQASGGRLVAEPMAFNPYVMHRRNIGGDMWASSLLTLNHGLLVVRGFSEWVHADLLLSQGFIGIHDANCAFNRSAVHPGEARGVHSRLLLANFTPSASLLVPVLFDRARVPESSLAAGSREFVVISDDPPMALEQVGIDQIPLNLSLEAALEWLHIEIDALSGDTPPGDGDGDQVAIDFEAVLADNKAEAFEFSLYKSA